MAGGLGRKNKVNTPATDRLVSAETTVLWLGV
jgi:hypothetical protein